MDLQKNMQNSGLFEARYHFKEKKSNIRFYAFILFIIALMACLYGYWTTNFGGVTVSGDSMLNTLHTDDQLLLKYVDGKDAKRGDIIVVYVGGYEEITDGTEYLIKRLIAIEGDRVKCTDGQISIMYAGTDTWVDLYEPYARYTDKAAYDFKKEYVVGEGEVFFLGDNRNHSGDSRYQDGGSKISRLYKAEDIIGVVPQWAVDNKDILEKILFWNTKK